MTISIEEPGDLDRLADGLEELLDAERPFGLVVAAPTDFDALQQMLWTAPSARRRLRRLRARLTAWCETTAHVLSQDAHARRDPSTLTYAELVWGCEAIAADCPQTARASVLERLASRPAPVRDYV